MKIDRRILYILGAVLVVLTILLPLGLPVKVSALTQQTYDAIQNLPDGSLVILSPMYDPGSAGELNPQFKAMLHQCMQRGYKIVIVNTLWTLGPQLVHPVVTQLAEEYGYQYGVNYIELGSKPGSTVWLQGIVNDFIGNCLTDYNNQPLDRFPIMQEVPKVTKEYVAATLVCDCGTPGAPQWLQYVNQPTGIPLIVAEIQMSVPENMPYVQTGQFAGMITGSRGCAEYEQLIGKPGQALKSQDTMSVIAIMVALFIILGNIGYLARKK